MGNIQQTKDNITSQNVYLIQPNIGIGIKLKNLTIDYALTNLGRQSDGAPYSNVFSLKLDIFKQASLKIPTK